MANKRVDTNLSKARLLQILQELGGFTVEYDEAGNIEPKYQQLGAWLGITTQTLRMIPDPVSHQGLKGIVGDLVRLRRRVPEEIVKALQK